MSFLNRYVSDRMKDSEFKREWENSQVEYEIARQIIKIRKEKGLTQAGLAELIHSKQSAISRIENGDQNVTLGTLKKIASVLNTKIQLEIDPDFHEPMNQSDLIKN
ncbi:helix-turn-helix domain-containing protein [Lederbergia sp. NSJ-179]|uniref:helix-turn-helix domain-containing protein n=1 Tax=Lederbergia sp. NSJ-179 TaxID=2931402 RepID=UPI001FD13314|nr:helix-turn-helix transcriptional regulator [Lederbergia sp. NSJ-179]MCJ7842568.1 helix-turn-helix domain-containing protein [Lederbergia sp. NSJ-179]